MGSSTKGWVGILQRWAELAVMIVVLSLLITATVSNDWVHGNSAGGTFYAGLYNICYGSSTRNCVGIDQSALQLCIDNASGDAQSFCKNLRQAQGFMPGAVVLSIFVVLIQLVIACTCNCCGCCGGATCIQRTGIVSAVLSGLTFILGIIGWNFAHTAFKSMQNISIANLRLSNVISINDGVGNSTATAAWVLAMMAMLIGISLQFYRYRIGDSGAAMDAQSSTQTTVVIQTTALPSPLTVDPAGIAMTFPPPAYTSSAPPVPTRPSQTSTDNKFCMGCGASLPATAAFCNSCGQKQ